MSSVVAAIKCGPLYDKGYFNHKQINYLIFQWDMQIRYNTRQRYLNGVCNKIGELFYMCFVYVGWKGAPIGARIDVWVCIGNELMAA